MGNHSNGHGRFIVFEGIDGAGTTTQACQAASHLRSCGRKVHLTCEPSTGAIGKLLREVLRSGGGDLGGSPMNPAAVALLFAADRLEHVQKEVTANLKAGCSVICDRYVISSLAYQSVDLDVEFVAAINQLAPKPDLTCFLRVPAKVGMARIEARGHEKDRFERVGFQTEVAERYEAAIKRNVGKVVILDGEVAISDIQSQVRTLIDSLFDS
jgi:dTMP kinase